MADVGSVGKESTFSYIGSMKGHSLLNSLLLPRYLLRALAGPFLFSLFTLMFLFLLQFVMKFIDQLVGKGLSAWLIIELVALNLAWMVVLAVPMAVLVATLMAFGDLSSRNEITAMKASGMSIYRMLLPVLAAATLVAVLLVYFNNDVLPEANHRAKTLLIDIRRKKPTLSIVAGSFSEDIPGYSILVRRTFERSNDLEGITLYDHTNPSGSVAITAERGKISFSPDYRKLIMDLQNGEIHQLDLQRKSAYRRVRFENHRIAMNVQGFDFERSAEGTFDRGDRELSASAMLDTVASLRAQVDLMKRELGDSLAAHMERRLEGVGEPDPRVGIRYGGFSADTRPMMVVRTLGATATSRINQIVFNEKKIDQYMVEVHKKYAIPAACLVFVLIGLPLGIMSRRGGFGIAATLSLGFFVLYWAFLVGGEKLADRALISPFSGMWAANILLGLVGVYLTIRIGRETMLIDWTAFRKLVPRRFRTAPLTNEQDHF
jgi:lipopolysaccharide export system permease protein